MLHLNAGPPKLFGVYAQKGTFHLFKKLIFTAIVTLRRARGGVTSITAEGARGRPSFAQMEKPQPLSTHPKVGDSLLQYCYDTNAMLYFKHPSVGLLQLPRMPDTLLFGDRDRWQAEGLSIHPLVPMGTWAISYEGPMRVYKDEDDEDQATGEIVDVRIEVEWSANFDHFDFDSDLDVGAMARAMAKEKWSREYFNNLRDAHQTHYEQMGALKGTAMVAGTTYSVELESMRDHSYGHRREWRLLHRYALHMLHLQDGTQLNVGIVSQPVSCSNLELGYVCHVGSRRPTPVSEVGFQLWNFGERGSPPDDYAFSFVAGGRRHVLEVQGVEGAGGAPVFFMGWQWEARIVEKFVRVKLDGVPGWGVVEFQYNQGPGDHRPPTLAGGDPTWTLQLNKG
ncbi:uncharacterized protein LOC108665910 [Hyalella azteca]|uniref:Uncharacterized protein LOC108665910 n=1 Tax=Hyalella azteca TaxID=294128 RepID=A0A8B7N3N3_HYAAZ|nr:uncharacterized protein LOC108665910 [Hyalella azteca]